MRDVCGIILFNKPVGLSSHQVSQKVKQIFGAKKAGHTGSLDILASGLLPVCLGKATKISQYLLNADKYYLVTAKLGECTTTGDLEGEIIKKIPVGNIDIEQLKSVLSRFCGAIQQIPPMFSALKYHGMPLYKLARQGVSVERQARTVNVYELILTNLDESYFTLQVHCSKGTYVRTLVEDIGQALGYGAHVTELIRTGVGNYHASSMVTLNGLKALLAEGGYQTLDTKLLSMESALSHLPVVMLSAFELQLLRQRKSIEAQCEISELARLTDKFGHFLGVGCIQNGRLNGFKPI
jgi:tRNA pseudouridine55 synthase